MYFKIHLSRTDIFNYYFKNCEIALLLPKKLITIPRLESKNNKLKKLKSIIKPVSDKIKPELNSSEP